MRLRFAMTRRTTLALPFLALAAVAQKKRKPQDYQRPPDLEVLEITVRRNGGVLEFDGRVRNCGDRPIQQLKLVFHLLSSDDKVITTQRGDIDPALLEPGEETSFEWQARDHARAVSVRIEATNRNADDLKVVKPGPYPID
jgi:hypothetical protein